MTEEQISRQIKTIEDATKEASKSKESALKFLKDAGILDILEAQQKEYPYKMLIDRFSKR